jgi:hypothetical protein
MGVELVALGHEMLGVGEFYTSGYWGGKLYIDKTKAVFGALGTNQGNLLGLLSGQTMEAGKAATERGTKVSTWQSTPYTYSLMSQHQLHHVDESTPTAPHCL